MVSLERAAQIRESQRKWISNHKELHKKMKNNWYEKNKYKVKESAKIWYANNPEKVKHISRRANLKKYKITIKEYDELLKIQNGRCLICHKHESDLPKRLTVDHCHNTGKVRGLLCVQCNLILGNSKESIETLENCIKYLNNNS